MTQAPCPDCHSIHHYQEPCDVQPWVARALAAEQRIAEVEAELTELRQDGLATSAALFDARKALHQFVGDAVRLSCGCMSWANRCSHPIHEKARALLSGKGEGR